MSGPGAPRGAGLSVVRACLLGAGAAMGIAGLLLSLGALPAASELGAALGVVAAVVASLLAAVGHARMMRAPVVPPPRAMGGPAGHRPEAGGPMALAAGAGVTRALALGFLARLALLVAGVVALWAAGLKFPQVAAFAIAFATASLLIQLCAAAAWNRAVARRQAPAGSVDPVQRP